MNTLAGHHMREYRKRTGLSQTQLARHVGVRQSTISDIERGVIDPSTRLAKRLAALLGVSLDTLLAEPLRHEGESVPCLN